MANTAKAGSSAKLLYCEGDIELLEAQTGAIQKAGYQVETASDRKSVLAALGKGNFGMVVLGPSLSKNDRHHLAYMVKKASESTRVLVLHTDGERHPAVDAHLDTGCSLDSIVTKITSMMPAAVLTRAAAAGR